ncbi:hypothetical protein AB0L04_00440 [Streptomyces glaucescens]|uniref:hypothetical protein n=1 Tax=Streptomyces glaucescens TaxID=1907 RepID=UPI00344DE7B6
MTFAPRTWVVGEVVTAALLNQEVRDQFNSFFGAWTSYTPTWAGATTNPTLGNGTLTGRYMKVGRTVTAEIKLTTGSTSTYGSGIWRWSLPAAAASAHDAVGTAFVGDASAGYSIGVAYVSASNTDVTVYVGSPTAGAAVSGSHPQTFAAGDRVWITVQYEAAS